MKRLITHQSKKKIGLNTKRSTEEAIEKMESAKVRCWNKTHITMKWKLALRIANSPCDRWLR